MRSTAGRALLGAALLIAAIVLFLVLQGDDGDGGPVSRGGGDAKAQARGQGGDKGKGKPDIPPEASIPSIVVRDGKPLAGIEELEFAAGDRVRFQVQSNAADEIHIHGYDVTEEVEPGSAARFDFPATIEGVFEVELHHSSEQIAELRVNP